VDSVASLTPNAEAATFCRIPRSRKIAFRSVIVEATLPSPKLAAQEQSSAYAKSSVWRRSVLSGQRAASGMPALPESSAEIEARRAAALAEQKAMLEHIPAWLKLRRLRQKDVAAALGVSEATVSQWIGGKHQMSVGQLHQIALLLQAAPGDLLRAPDGRELSQKVEETLELMEELSDQEWSAVLATARSIAAAKRRD
jgi:transcriptional regulator with XRE-family HTH domain